MSLKLALAVLGALVVLTGYVRAMPGYGHGHGAVSHQNNNLGGGGYGHDAGHGHGYKQVDYYARPYYNYAYAVNDHYTGDQKSAHEHRDGDKVTGEYSLREADGSWRRVTYHADHTGFHAKVHKTPGHHPHGHGQGHGHGGH